MVIVDRELALVPVDPNDPVRGALELRSPGVVAGLVALFEQVWHAARPFGGEASQDEQGLTAQERELLRLLAAGNTDEFQAGVQATRRGWV